MASLKQLKSVAHNLAQHFSSTLSYWKNDYTIHHLAAASEKHNVQKIEVDVLKNTIKPDILNKGVIKEFLPQYLMFLKHLLNVHKLDQVELERVIVQYDFDVDRINEYNLPTYNCVSQIKTKTGRVFEANLTENS